MLERQVALGAVFNAAPAPPLAPPTPPTPLAPPTPPTPPQTAAEVPALGATLDGDATAAAGIVAGSRKRKRDGVFDD